MSTNPVLTLIDGDDSVNTLKVVWSSKVYDVPIKAGSKKLAKSSGCFAHGPALLYGSSDEQQQVVSGGNCMSKAISLLGESSSSNTTSNTGMMNVLIDQWCEFERVKLRSAVGNKKKLDTLLNDVETALEKSGSVHVIGHTMTIADICILSTLLSAIDNNATLLNGCSPVIQNYVNAHTASYKQIKESLSDYAAPSTTSAKIDLSNPSIQTVLTQIFTNSLIELFDLSVENLPPNLVKKTKDVKHGDYQCDAAMPIFALLKKNGSASEFNLQKPQDVAKQIVSYIEDNDDGKKIIKELQIAGPGFVMFRIASTYLQPQINNFITSKKLISDEYKKSKSNDNDVCVVDFSSPNIAKEMHVGHLRSTIIGESVCRILEYVGYDVKRINHVGDWGTQFGMLIQYLKEEYPNFHNAPDDVNITDLTVFYKNAKKRFDDSEEFKEKSRLNVVKLQSGDDECKEIWNLLCDISRREFKKVYNRLDISNEEYGESFYNDKIPPVIKEFENANLISVEEGGAKCVFVDPKISKIPLMLQKSDGGFGYDSTDMAALKYRIQELDAKRIIAITDYTQGDHFKMCFDAANKIGWLEGDKYKDVKLEHIGFGTVQGEDGKRFKTRSGDTVRLVDLLDEAVDRMEKSLKERITDGKANITVDEVHQVAEAIGYGAVKYFDLRRNPTSNYKFSYDEMLSTSGNTAVYLLYAHARLESIISKAKKDFNVDIDDVISKNGDKSDDLIKLDHASERNLALQLQTFTDIMEITLDDLFPYHICEYLYNISIATSDFVKQCKVLGSDEMTSRLCLCRATTTAMKQCFDLLAIRHVERI